MTSSLIVVKSVRETISSPALRLVEARDVSQRVRRPGDRAQLAPWQVNLAMQIMEGQIHRTLSLAEVASPLGVSVNHFIKGFVNSVGTSPYHWFIRQRIARSVELLRTKDMPLAEIAAECGFSDQSHFTRVFTRRLGMTPGKWRRMVPVGEISPPAFQEELSNV
jgi:AraC family transcriptional regulator